MIASLFADLQKVQSSPPRISMVVTQVEVGSSRQAFKHSLLVSQHDGSVDLKNLKIINPKRWANIRFTRWLEICVLSGAEADAEPG